jgi:membrane protease YdiL (CAAX protease family)
MKTRSKIELALSVIITFAIPIIYSMILKPVLNDTGRMIVKPLVNILLAVSPLIVCRVMKNPIGTLGFKKDKPLKQVLSGIGVFAAFELVFTIIVLILGSSKGILLPAKESSIGIIIYYIFLDILFVGICEETVFRGYLMERFRTLANSGIWAVVISALLFGIWHFPSGQDYLQVVITALLGVIFGLARLKIKNCSTLSVGIAHGLHDAYILILSCFLL